MWNTELRLYLQLPKETEYVHEWTLDLKKKKCYWIYLIQMLTF